MSEIEEIAKQVLALDEQREPSNVCFAVCRTAAPRLAKAVIELTEQVNATTDAAHGTVRALQKQLADCRAALAEACDGWFRCGDSGQYFADRISALRKAGGL